MNKDDLYPLFEHLFEQLPLGVIISSLNGKILFVNKSAESIRKISRDAIIGSNVVHCHSLKTQNNVIRAIDNLIKNPDIKYKRMVNDIVNDSFYTNSYIGIQNDVKELIGMAVITEDITEKRKTELAQAEFSQIQKETINNITMQYHNLAISSLESISSLLEAKDSYTQNHSENVCRTSLILYEYMYGINDEYYDLKDAALLHDIGKIGIPDSILNKVSPLSDADYHIIKQHSILAEKILMPLDAGKQTSLIIKHHHERYDGTGYPDGLSGKEIPLGSRIIALADAYDAMSSDRPYRNALSFEQCIAEIASQSGKQFDPAIAEAFIELAMTGSL